ncbi:MAG TPA: hypothetical protein PKE66_14890, partial [Pyrinomonadaceae bacterium]|nr:hypothetical protein [Pyrinomonadaceae bacterium]
NGRRFKQSNTSLVYAQEKGHFRCNYLNAVPIRNIYDRWINKYANHSVDVLTNLSRDMESK